MILKQRLSRRIRSRLAIVMTLVLLLGMISSSPVAAQGSGPAPTIRDLRVESYDCETGVIEFHMYVTDLPHVPDGTHGDDYPLMYSYEAFYEVGMSRYPTLFLTFRPSANEAPYTGNLILSETVPPNNVKPGLSAPGGPITSIDVSVWVGYGGGNGGAAAVPSDSAQITYIVDCDDDDPSTGDIIQQLIAVLIALLRTLLNR